MRIEIQPRRQAVRHLTLTQTFGGSNPSGAASFKQARHKKTRRKAGFLLRAIFVGMYRGTA